jgi:hypothetical protein
MAPASAPSSSRIRGGANRASKGKRYGQAVASTTRIALLNRVRFQSLRDGLARVFQNKSTVDC